MNGERFETDAGGELWTLAPHRYEFSVRAVGPEGNATIEVRTLPVTSASRDA